MGGWMDRTLKIKQHRSILDITMGCKMHKDTFPSYAYLPICAAYLVNVFIEITRIE